MHVDDVLPAHLHLHLLLAEGHEQVFHQPPVEESSILVDPRHLQAGKLAHLRQGLLRGGHQTLLLVEVDEHFQLVARLAPLVHIALGKQDFTFNSPVEVQAEIDLLHHPQCIVFT